MHFLSKWWNWISRKKYLNVSDYSVGKKLQLVIEKFKTSEEGIKKRTCQHLAGREDEHSYGGNRTGSVNWRVGVTAQVRKRFRVTGYGTRAHNRRAVWCLPLVARLDTGRYSSACSLLHLNSAPSDYWLLSEINLPSEIKVGIQVRLICARFTVGARFPAIPLCNSFCVPQAWSAGQTWRRREDGKQLLRWGCETLLLLVWWFSCSLLGRSLKEVPAAMR